MSKPIAFMKAVCFLLRRHAWRRLRKSELLGDPFERICSRCGLRRSVRRSIKPRKAKVPA